MISDSIWIREILALQRPDGSWGNFHTLSWPVTGRAITTEEALRRLYVLGLTEEDEPIRRAIAYMEWHLAQPVSTIFFEKKHDPKIFTDLMLATWLRLFQPKHPAALHVAGQWAAVVEAAFEGGKRDQSRYLEVFESQFGKRPHPQAWRLVNFDAFYQVILLQGMLPHETESAMLDYLLDSPEGIYYVYNKPLREPPAFTSHGASRYLGALELLAGYALAPEKLGFAVDWLQEQSDSNGQWDMGPQAKDGVYFPLSDSWRKAEDRRRDCSERIAKLLRRLDSLG